MELGLGVLRLAPQEFWKATPREIAAATGIRAAGSMPRGALDDLMHRYPDGT